MTLREYADELGISIEQLLKACEKLDIKVNNEDDFLDDDAIVMLDMEMESNEPEENLLSEEREDKYDFEDRAEELIEDKHIKEEKTASKVKLKKQTNKNKQI